MPDFVVAGKIGASLIVVPSPPFGRRIDISYGCALLT